MSVKVTGHFRIKFFIAFPPSIQDFFFIYNITVRCPCLLLFRFKISLFIPSWISLKPPLSVEGTESAQKGATGGGGFNEIQEGTNSDILNLNNKRQGHLTVMLYIKKSLVLMGKIL